MSPHRALFAHRLCADTASAQRLHRSLYPSRLPALPNPRLHALKWLERLPCTSLDRQPLPHQADLNTRRGQAEARAEAVDLGLHLARRTAVVHSTTRQLPRLPLRRQIPHPGRSPSAHATHVRETSRHEERQL